jgi:hypothetical protein
MKNCQGGGVRKVDIVAHNDKRMLLSKGCYKREDRFRKLQPSALTADGYW